MSWVDSNFLFPLTCTGHLAIYTKTSFTFPSLYHNHSQNWRVIVDFQNLQAYALCFPKLLQDIFGGCKYFLPCLMTNSRRGQTRRGCGWRRRGGGRREGEDWEVFAGGHASPRSVTILFPLPPVSRPLGLEAESDFGSEYDDHWYFWVVQYTFLNSFVVYLLRSDNKKNRFVAFFQRFRKWGTTRSLIPSLEGMRG